MGVPYYAERVFRIFKDAKMSVLRGNAGAMDSYANVDLQRALDTLTESDRAVIILKYFEDKKLEEIADILEENVNTIKSRLYRGLKKLQGILADESGQEEQKTDSEAYCSSGMQKRAGRG